jgi:uncharacterized protein
MKQIGLISDTHGLLRPQAVRALSGVQQIIHAGDIGEGVLEALGQIAPVAAIRGNNDKGAWAAHIPETLELRVGGVRIHVIHDLKELTLDPVAAGFDVVVSGHSHKPSVTERDGVCYVNPGSAGPRRFSLPVTLAYLELSSKSRVAARILQIV